MFTLKNQFVVKYRRYFLTRWFLIWWLLRLNASFSRYFITHITSPFKGKQFIFYIIIIYILGEFIFPLLSREHEIVSSSESLKRAGCSKILTLFSVGLLIRAKFLLNICIEQYMQLTKNFLPLLVFHSRIIYRRECNFYFQSIVRTSLFLTRILFCISILVKLISYYY